MHQKRAERFLQKVHIDTIGPISPPDIRGRRYMFSAYDDKTEMSFVHFMKTKSAKENVTAFQTLFPKKVESIYLWRPRLGVRRGV